jgi:RNA recognition motif-containing protein
MESSVLWKLYRDFEQDEHFDLIETTTEKDIINKSKKSVIDIYSRQLGLPLINNEQCLVEFEHILENICVESDIAIIKPELILNKNTISMELREERILFEEFIKTSSLLSLSLSSLPPSSEIDNDRIEKEKQILNSWKTYSKFEISQNQLSRAQRIYERALLDSLINTKTDIWHEYIDFASYTLKNWSLVLSISSRGMRCCSGDMYLTNMKLLSLEMLNKDNKTIMNVYDNILNNGLKTAEDYLNILLYKCDYKRRILSKLVIEGKSSVQVLIDNVIILRKTFDEVEVFLNNYYPTWDAGYFKFYKHYLSNEDEGVSDIIESIQDYVKDDQLLVSQSSTIWEKAIGKFSKNYYIWSEYIKWARINNDFILCRKLYKKVITTNICEYLNELCNEWKLFEMQTGTISQLNDCYICIKHVQDINIRNKIQQDLIASKANTTSSSVSSKHNKEISDIKMVVIPNEKVINAQMEKLLANKKLDTDKKRNLDELKIQIPKLKSNNGVNKEDNINDDNDRKRIRFEDENNLIDHENVEINNDKNYSVLVTNFSFNATKEEIHSHFCATCDITSVSIILSKSGKSRGQAIINLKDETSLTNALKLNETIFGIRPLLVTRNYKPIDEFITDASSLPSSINDSIEENSLTTVFVTKIPPNYTDNDLRLFFADCGSIVEARILIDKRSGVSKCQGMVQFTIENERKEALKKNKSLIDGKHVTVLPSKFQALLPKKPNNAESNYNSSNVDGNKKENTKSFAIQVTSFKPRVLAKAKINLN